jgi:hypothetical protein
MYYCSRFGYEMSLGFFLFDSKRNIPHSSCDILVILPAHDTHGEKKDLYMPEK